MSDTTSILDLPTDPAGGNNNGNVKQLRDNGHIKQIIDNLIK